MIPGKRLLPLWRRAENLITECWLPRAFDFCKHYFGTRKDSDRWDAFSKTQVYSRMLRLGLFQDAHPITNQELKQHLFGWPEMAMVVFLCSKAKIHRRPTPIRTVVEPGGPQEAAPQHSQGEGGQDLSTSCGWIASSFGASSNASLQHADSIGQRFHLG